MPSRVGGSGRGAGLGIAAATALIPATSDAGAQARRCQLGCRVRLSLLPSRSAAGPGRQPRPQRRCCRATPRGDCRQGHRQAMPASAAPGSTSPPPSRSAPSLRRRGERGVPPPSTRGHGEHGVGQWGQQHLTADKSSGCALGTPPELGLERCAGSWAAPGQAIDSLGHCVSVPPASGAVSRWLGPALGASRRGIPVPGTGSGTWRLRRHVIYRVGVR